MSEVQIRASDAERDRTVQLLRGHAASGRLDADELEERVGLALAARTREDLGRLTADLPHTVGRTGAERVARRRAARDAELRTYAAVIALLVAIWLLTGVGHPWPLYPALGWGLGLYLKREACGSGRERRRIASPL